MPPANQETSPVNPSAALSGSVLTRRVFRPIKLLLGYGFAAMLLAIGIALINDDLALRGLTLTVLALVSPMDQAAQLAFCQWLAVTAIAGAQVVFMVLVADDLCPFAPMEVTGLLKLSASLVVWGALGAAAATWLGFL